MISIWGNSANLIQVLLTLRYQFPFALFMIYFSLDNKVRYPAPVL